MFKQNHTEQTRKSISLTMKGQLGHLHTEILRGKICEAHLGKTLSKENRDKNGAALKPTRWYTEETKAKLWLAMHSFFISFIFF